MGHWTPTGVEPKDYDDDDDSKKMKSPSLHTHGCRRTILRDCLSIFFYIVIPYHEVLESHPRTHDLRLRTKHIVNAFLHTCNYNANAFQCSVLIKISINI